VSFVQADGVVVAESRRSDFASVLIFRASLQFHGVVGEDDHMQHSGGVNG
jgi:hypothetical protein